MNTKLLLLLILGLLLVSIRSQGTDGGVEGNETETGDGTEEGDEIDGDNVDTEEPKDDVDLCMAETTKDGCLKVKLSADDKKCCFYKVVNTTDNEDEEGCNIQMSAEVIEGMEAEGIKVEEDCHGKFITTSILVVLALLFL